MKLAHSANPISYLAIFARGLGTSALSAGVMLSVWTATAAATTLKTLYNFAGPPDVLWPLGQLVMDQSGNLYGTSHYGGKANGGAVFEVSPPRSGGTKWTEKVLYSFEAPGGIIEIESSLLLAPSGILYGTPFNGGSNGAGSVFQLSPPSGLQKTWVYKTVYSFSLPAGNTPHNLDGAYPEAGSLVMDGAGNLYGFASGGGDPSGCPNGLARPGAGAIFRLAPPAAGGTQWTNTLLHSFTYANCGVRGEVDMFSAGGGVTLGPDGFLYGAGAADQLQSTDPTGGIFRLSPPPSEQGDWTYSVLYYFKSNGHDGQSPEAAPVLGSKGGLYGVTTRGGKYDCGTVYRLVPADSANVPWTEDVLYSFRYAQAPDLFYRTNDVAIDAVGDIYGTAVAGGPGNNGFVFELSPPTGTGLSWTYRNLATFGLPVHGAYPKGIQPYGPPLVASGPVLLGTTSDGGRAVGGGGTLFAITP